MGRHLKLLGYRFHSTRLIVAQSDNFDLGMLVSHPQIVAHMHVIKTDAGNFPASHAPSFGLMLGPELLQGRVGNLFEPRITWMVMFLVRIVASRVVATDEGGSAVG